MTTMTATVEMLNADECCQEFQQLVTTQLRDHKITEDEVKAVLSQFGAEGPLEVKSKDRAAIRTMIEARIERNLHQLAEEASEDSIWHRSEANQLTVEMPTQLYPENTYTELNPEGLKEFWKLMVDPEDNNAIFRECLWRILDELPDTLRSREIRFEAIIDLLRLAQYDALEEAWDLLTSLNSHDPLLPRIWAAIDSSPWQDWTCLETRYDVLRWRLATDDVNEDHYRELLRIADHAHKFGHNNLLRTVTVASVILENMLRDKKALQTAVDVPQIGRRTYRPGKLKLE
jgi:hypothetical protein